MLTFYFLQARNGHAHGVSLFINFDQVCISMMMLPHARATTASQSVSKEKACIFCESSVVCS